MIRYLLKVERGTIVHFLKWGVALLAFIAGLWLALTLFGNPGVRPHLERPDGGPAFSWQRAGPGRVLVAEPQHSTRFPAPGHRLTHRRADR